jgi:hypothetical protein
MAWPYFTAGQAVEADARRIDDHGCGDRVPVRHVDSSYRPKMASIRARTRDPRLRGEKHERAWVTPITHALAKDAQTFALID